MKDLKNTGQHSFLLGKPEWTSNVENHVPFKINKSWITEYDRVPLGENIRSTVGNENQISRFEYNTTFKKKLYNDIC